MPKTEPVRVHAQCRIRNLLGPKAASIVLVPHEHHIVLCSREQKWEFQSDKMFFIVNINFFILLLQKKWMFAQQLTVHCPMPKGQFLRELGTALPVPHHAEHGRVGTTILQPKIQLRPISGPAGLQFEKKM